MKKKIKELYYKGSKGWLIFWIIVAPLIALFLVIFNLKKDEFKYDEVRGKKVKW